MGKKESLAKFNAKRKRKRAEVTEASKSFRTFVDRGVHDIIMDRGYEGEIGSYNIADGHYKMKVTYQISPIGEEDSNMVEQYQTKLEEDFIKKEKNLEPLNPSIPEEETKPVVQIIEDDPIDTSNIHEDPDTSLQPSIEPVSKAELGPKQIEVEPPLPEPPAPIPEPDDPPEPELQAIPISTLQEPEPVIPKKELEPPKDYSPIPSYDDDEAYQEFIRYREFVKRRRERSEHVETASTQPPVHHRERRQLVRRDTLAYPRDNENEPRFQFLKSDKRSFKFI